VWSLDPEMLQNRVETLPGDAMSLTASVEPFLQGSHGFIIELPQALIVPIHAIVIVVPSQLGIKLSKQVAQLLPSILLAPFAKLFQ
jgi:hypothetical protein